RRGDRMKRRDFITLLGSTAAWPLAARAQQAERVRRIGVLMPQAESDPEQRSWATAFATRLRELGWRQGENAQIDYRWLGGDTTRAASLAKELVDLQPDVLQPAMYPYRFFVADGGLMSYGTDLADLYRRAAFYIDRILKGAKPSELPVQQPTKFEFVINIKTA